MTVTTCEFSDDLCRLVRARKSLYAQRQREFGPTGIFLFAGWLRLEEMALARLGPAFQDAPLVEGQSLSGAAQACRTNFNLYLMRRYPTLRRHIDMEFTRSGGQVGA